MPCREQLSRVMSSCSLQLKWNCVWAGCKVCVSANAHVGFNGRLYHATAACDTVGCHHRWWVSLPTMPHRLVSAVKYPISGTLLVSGVRRLMEEFFILLFHGSEHIQYIREKNVSSLQGPWRLILQCWADWRTEPWPSWSGLGQTGEGPHQCTSSSHVLDEGYLFKIKKKNKSYLSTAANQRKSDAEGPN